MKTKIPPLLKELKAAEWKSHKSIIAKILRKKSGLSEALGAVEDKYDAFTKAAALAMARQMPVEAVEALESAEFTELEKAIKAAGKIAKEKADEWKPKTCPVPKKTRDYAELIKTAADDFVPSLTIAMNELKEEAATQEKEITDELVKGVKKAVEIATAGIGEIKKDPTPATYNAYMNKSGGNGLGRKLTTALQGPIKIKVDVGFDCQKHITALTPYGNGDRMTVGNDADATAINLLVSDFTKLVMALIKDMGHH